MGKARCGKNGRYQMYLDEAANISPVAKLALEIAQEMREEFQLRFCNS